MITSLNNQQIIQDYLTFGKGICVVTKKWNDSAIMYTFYNVSSPVVKYDIHEFDTVNFSTHVPVIIISETGYFTFTKEYTTLCIK